MIAPTLFYQGNKPCIAVLFDTADPRQCSLLHELRAVFQEDSDVAALNEDLFVLLIRPGGARRLAA